MSDKPYLTSKAMGEIKLAGTWDLFVKYHAAHSRIFMLVKCSLILKDMTNMFIS